MLANVPVACSGVMAKAASRTCCIFILKLCGHIYERKKKIDDSKLSLPNAKLPMI